MKSALIVAAAAGLVLILRDGLRYLAGIYKTADSDDAINTAWYC